jgi:hypothetical protein
MTLDPLRSAVLKNQRLRDLLALLVLPRIAEWHVQLSGMLADPKPITTYADVLSKVGFFCIRDGPSVHVDLNR